MKQHRNRLLALLFAAVLVLLAAVPAFAVADDPDPFSQTVANPLPTAPEPTQPSPEQPQAPTGEVPAEETPTGPAPTAGEPTSEPPTQHAHAFGRWETVRRATAKKAGRQQRVCSCGAKQTRAIARVAKIALKYKDRVYNGKALANPVSVKNTAGKALKKGKDYSVKYQNNKNVGKAVVVFTGKGNYIFTARRTFAVLPRTTAVRKVLPAATNAAVQWKAVSAQCGGYQLQAATDSGFRHLAAVRRITNAQTTAATLNGLKAQTAYFLRIRTFKEVKGTSFYSAWSETVSFKTGSVGGHAIDGQLPKTARVSASYFDDAVFIGDSVSLGLSYYEAAADVLGSAQFLTAGSLGSGNALQPVSEKSVHPRYNGQKMKVEKAVAACGAKKVYIMLGMNDIGAYGVEKSANNFRTLCKRILAESPFVKIYVESVTPRVNQGGKADNVKLNNKNITRYNELLAKICVEEDWYFVNVAETMFDSTGHLKRAYCSDPDGMGMHFSFDGCKAWVDYLYTHTA